MLHGIVTDSYFHLTFPCYSPHICLTAVFPRISPATSLSDFSIFMNASSNTLASHFLVILFSEEWVLYSLQSPTLHSSIIHHLKNSHLQTLLHFYNHFQLPQFASFLLLPLITSLVTSEPPWPLCLGYRGTGLLASNCHLYLSSITEMHTYNFIFKFYNCIIQVIVHIKTVWKIVWQFL